MIKKLLVLVIVVFATYSVNAQAAFEKGDKALNAGINLGGGSLVPGVTASLEFGLFPIGNAGVISLGGNVDVNLYTDSSYPIRISPAFRAAFHAGFLNTEKFDVYAGINSGYSFRSGEYYSNYMFIRDFIGGRYMFKENMGVFAELPLFSWSATNLRGGICFFF